MTENQSGPKKDLFLPASIIAAAVIVAGAVIYIKGPKIVPEPRPVTGKTLTIPIPDDKTLIDDDVILGELDAPVTIVEFGDYQCPYCEKLFTDTEGKLREEYIKTGKAKMVYRDFPLTAIHPEAQPSAEAAGCAQDQGKFWAYHDLLFKRQAELSGADYVAWAVELGLDKAKFKACVDSHKYAAEIAKDYEDGVRFGINGTPGTFINGKLIPGAQPYSVFKKAIDDALLAK